MVSRGGHFNKHCAYRIIPVGTLYCWYYYAGESTLKTTSLFKTISLLAQVSYYRVSLFLFLFFTSVQSGLLLSLYTVLKALVVHMILLA